MSNKTNSIDQAQTLASDISKGMTMEIPYKVFGNPSQFWMLVRRNLAPGIPHQKLSIRNENNLLSDTQAAMITALNNFTSVTDFNAEGLKKDGVVPSDDVFKEWAKDIRYMLTVVDDDANSSIKKMTIGAIHTSPWRGVCVDVVLDFFMSFHMDSEGNYFLEPSVAKPEPKENTFSCRSGLLELFTHAANFSTGQVPSLITPEEMHDNVKKVFANLEKTKTFSEEDLALLADVQSRIFSDLNNYVRWSGNGPSMEFTISVKEIPVMVDGQVLTLLPINVTARGDYQFNVYYFVTVNPNPTV